MLVNHLNREFYIFNLKKLLYDLYMNNIRLGFNLHKIKFDLNSQL